MLTDRQAHKKEQMIPQNYTNFESVLAMMVIYINVKINLIGQ